MVKRQRIQLPRTGQTTSYVDGDDGYFQAGNPRAPRFVDNGNGTISDRATGLQWVKQPELIIPGAVGIDATNLIQSAEGNWADATAYVLADLVADTTDSKFYVCVFAHTSDNASGTDTDAPNTGSAYWRETVWTASAANLVTPATMAWADAVANSLALEYAGFTDWRLSNILEIVCLWDFGSATGGAFSPFVTPPDAQPWSWTSTTYPTYTGFATSVRLNYPGQCQAVSKTNSYYARPVRGGRING